MQRLAFRYLVDAQVTLSGRELGLLRRLATTRYDGKCKSIARRGEGGWLRGHVMMAVEKDDPGWGVPGPPDGWDKTAGEDPYEAYLTEQVEREDPEYTLALDAHRLDTLCKVLENIPPHPLFDAELAAGLQIAMRRTLVDVNAEQRRANEGALNEAVTAVRFLHENTDTMWLNTVRDGVAVRIKVEDATPQEALGLVIKVLSTGEEDPNVEGVPAETLRSLLP